jgi:uncharacterized iron-regulated membrane protein
MKTRSLKAWYLVHKWTSLICTAFLLMLCLTGLPLIFHHEIDHVLGAAEPLPMPAGTPRASLDSMVAKAKAEHPSEAMQYVFTDEDEPDVWYVAMGETANAWESSVFYTFDARTRELLDTWTADDKEVMDVIFQLHYDLFAGLPGTLFLGFMGLLFVIALISGTMVYGPFMRKLPFGTVRKGRSPRTRWLDLHNLLGIAALVWLLVVGTTGVINTLLIPIFGYWQNTELAEMTAPYKDKPPLEDIGSVDKALATAQAFAPEMEVSFIAFPGNGFAGSHHYAAYLRGQEPLTSKLLKPLLIDARTSAVVDTHEMPWYISALLLSQPLHFGDYGGLPLKILWALLDILAIVVLGSGVYLWVKRRNISFEARLRALQEEDALGNGTALTASRRTEFT